MKIPVIDLHCDLTYYLLDEPQANPLNTEIGCAIPHLKEGNVLAQVLGFFTPSEPVQHHIARKQAEIFKGLLRDYGDDVAMYSAKDYSKVKIIAAIENASGFCHEDQKLEDGLKELEKIIEICGSILYIGFMHWNENRFGGAAGNNAGLKNDGKILLDYLNNRNIAVDLAHAGDNLISDIFNHVDNNNLNIPLIASHSNFREVWQHKRNLPDELAKEIIKRNGLIGINFMKDYLGMESASVIDHIEYGLKLGAEDILAIGADFFWDDNKPADKTYFKKYISATTYPVLLDEIASKFSLEIARKIAYGNAQTYMTKYFNGA
jgi:membrane dipeptidase